MSQSSTVGQVDALVLFRVFIGSCACIRVCFGLLEGYALWLECVEVVENGLEEGDFGWEFGEFGGDAVYDVGDGATVGVDGVILLLW